MADEAEFTPEVEAPAATTVPAVDAPAKAEPVAVEVAAPAIVEAAPVPAAPAKARQAKAKRAKKPAPATPMAAAPVETTVPEAPAAKLTRKPHVAKAISAAAVALAAVPRARKPGAAKVIKKPSARRAAAKLSALPAAKPAPQAAVKPVAKRRVTAKRPTLSGATAQIRQTSTIGTGMPTFTQLKDTIMATPFDFTKFQTAFTDIQGKAKAALEKSTAALGEANEFAKGNVEALVESGKILSSGLQELGSTAVAETRGAFDAMTADAKELAAAKSPTEFFQLQSAIARKQFDGAVAQMSKSTEAFLKLANDTFAPLSGRVTLAVEKVSKAA